MARLPNTLAPVSRFLRDLRRHGPRAARRMWRERAVIAGSGMFDAAFYRQAYPDVAAAAVDPIDHYVRYGASEGRDPNRAFSTRYYFARYPDVAALGGNPLAHFVLHGRAEGRVAVAAEIVPPSDGGEDPRKAVRQILKLRLRAWLDSGARLSLPRPERPRVSIILVLYNQAEFTLACLASIAETAGNSAEIIIVDNGSTDATATVLDRLDGCTIIRNRDNLHFLRAVNQALPKACGDHVLLLNNDAQLLAGSLDAALRTIESHDDIGAVCGRIIALDGRLQEAGGIVWNDASCAGYLRGAPPDHYAAMFRRDVDYGSGCFLLVRRSLFVELGGFDESLAPAYYEDTDLCIRLWERGYRVVYEPAAVILHHEFASSSSPAAAVSLQRTNQAKMAALHRKRLASAHLRPAGPNVLLARATDRQTQRILLIDDQVPHRHLGAGFPRMGELVRALVAQGRFVTFFPTLGAEREEWPAIRATLPDKVEVVTAGSAQELGAFLDERRGYYDVILASRPHNMRRLNLAFEEDQTRKAGCRVVYDAEALYATREIQRLEMLGQLKGPDHAERLRTEELGLTRWADTVLTVTEAEAEAFRTFGHDDVRVLGSMVEAHITQATFDDRNGFLFVGAVSDPDSPNVESLVWFIGEVMPRIRAALGPVPLRVVGANPVPRLRAIAGDEVEFLGRVADTAPCYEAARVFIAPTRLAAGLAQKVLETAAFGLPMVATPLVAGQAGWQDGDQLLTADSAKAFAAACIRLHSDPSLWQRLRHSASQAIERQYSAAAFADVIASVMDDSGFGRRERMAVAPPLADTPSQVPVDDIAAQLACASSIRWLIESFQPVAGGVEVSGWALTRHGQEEARVLLNGTPLSGAMTLPTPAAAERFPHLPEAAHAGFRVVGQGVQPFDDTGFARLDLVGGLGRHAHSYRTAWFVPSPTDWPEQPEDFRMARVIGVADAPNWLLGGATIYKRLEAYLSERFGLTYDDCRAVLDWGCGSGRVTRYFRPKPGQRVVGADIDADNIRWCEKHLRGIEFHALPLLPPTPFDDGAFDLAIGCSVFTHLHEDVQFQWLAELRRIIAPGGLALMSVTGPAQLALYGASGAIYGEIQRKGFHLHGANPNLEGVVADSYYMDVFHSHDYVRAVWSRYFDVIEIVDGIMANQDLVVMRRRD